MEQILGSVRKEKGEKVIGKGDLKKGGGPRWGRGRLGEREMKERVTGAGGGGVGRRENGEKRACPHYSIDMKSTLPIEVISSVDGGGGINFWSFVDTFCNFVRTN